MFTFSQSFSKSTRRLLLASIVLATVASSQAAIEEIIVTATKRPATLQDIPLTVTVVDSRTIEKARILDAQDLSSLVPSLRVNQLQTSQNTDFSIRGFGNGANNAGIEPSVGVFIDGVYRSRSAARLGDLPVLERVEVLSGPQSALFGKNASAGVVSIITKKPQFETEGYFEAGFGRFNENTFKAYATGAISEQLAVSIGGNYTRRDGYFTSIDEDLTNTNDRNRWSIRGQALFVPTDSIEARLIADYSVLDEKCCGVTNLVSSVTTDIINGLHIAGGGTGLAISPVSDPFSYQTYQNEDSINEIDDYGLSFHLDIERDNFNISSITAYRNNDSFFDTDSDFNRLSLLNSVNSDQKISTFTQEIRLTSNNEDNKFDWMLGGLLFSEDVDLVAGLEYGASLRPYLASVIGALNGITDPTLAQNTGQGTFIAIETSNNLAIGTSFAAGQNTVESFTQDDTTYSIFGTVDYHFSERITFSVGLNYTQSDKTVTGSTVNGDIFSSLDLAGTEGFNALVTFGIAENLPALAASCGLADSASVADVLASPTCVVSLDPFAATSGAVAFQALQQRVSAGVGTLDLTNPNHNPLLALQDLQFQPPFLAFPNAVEGNSTSDGDLTWSARLAADLNDNNNLYFSIATGFKASSWNLSRDSRPFLADKDAIESAGIARSNQSYGTRFASPEESIVYEIGLKSKYDNFAYNMAIFNQIIKNFQGNAFIGTAFVLTNAEEQEVQGVEVELDYSPTDNFQVHANLTILDPVYNSYTNAPGPEGAGSIDLTGEKPDNINEVALSIGFNYDFGVYNGITGYLRADYQYEQSTVLNRNLTLDSLKLSAAVNPLYTTTGSYPNYDERTQSIVNASLGLEFINDIELQIWGRNIFNDQFVGSLFPGVAQFGIINGYPNAPATYGVSVRKSF